MTALKKQYDFSTGRRGAALPPSSGKTRITIRLDHEVLDWFRAQVHERGGGSYQSLINEALRAHIERQGLETTLRRIVREELRKLKAR